MFSSYVVTVKWQGKYEETIKIGLTWAEVSDYMVDIYNSAMQESIDSIVIMPTDRYARLGALMDSVDPSVPQR